jgi:hypothetical protein
MQSGFRFLVAVILAFSTPPVLMAVTVQSNSANPDVELSVDGPIAIDLSQIAPGKPTIFWPDDVDFDVTITTPKKFFGFDIGFRHLTHAQVAAYVNQLARESDRISIEQYAQTHGGRPLLMLTITSPENRERLDEIKKSHRRLTKPQADRVSTDDLPAIINMGYGVHGDESSATNCAPLVAYYLAAAQGDEIEKWLRDCVILLDPSLNPDGFDRFANWANRYRGRVLNPDSQHAEHNQMWPPGRVNYYWFDLNRDWLPVVHPESRGRLKWYHQWKPNVVLDFHEMGTNSTFFFQPGIPQRTNPLTPARNQELTREFASYHAKALDQRGSLYFTQERFDDFYMGKGSTYPDLHGCVGILFEQASSRGHMQKNQDGLLRFSDTIANQFTTSLSSLRATTAMRKQLINFKKSFYKQSLVSAEKHPIKTYVFNCPNNRSRIEEFGRVLNRHDIQCFWLKEDLDYGDRSFDSEFTLVVPAKQPEFRFLRSLLMRQTNFQENIFYDVSSWTLPLAYGVVETGLKRNLDPEQLSRFQASPTSMVDPPTMEPDDVAYLIDFQDDAAPWVLTRLLSAGIKVRVATQPITMRSGDGASQEFGRGTLSVVVGTQPDKQDAIERILQLGSKRGAIITPVKTGLTESGPDLGSSNFPIVKKPNVAMMMGPGVSPYGAGEVWHLLDTQINLPVTLLQNSRFDRVNLDDYTTLILADGSFRNEHWEKVRGFVEQGGTVIAMGRLSVALEERLRGKKPTIATAAGDISPEEQPIQKSFDDAASERALQLISGAIFQTRIDTTHPLLFGFSGDHLAVFRNHAQFLQPSTNAYCNPVIYDADQPLLAGYCSDQNVEKFKGSASVVVYPTGRGRFILMADNPNFRGFWRATSRMFMNAVFFGELVDP